MQLRLDITRQQLNDESPHVRVAAAEDITAAQIRKEEHPEAIAALVMAAKTDPDFRVEDATLDSLRTFGQEARSAAAGVLFDHLLGIDKELKASAFLALQEVGFSARDYGYAVETALLAKDYAALTLLAAVASKLQEKSSELTDILLEASAESHHAALMCVEILPHACPDNRKNEVVAALEGLSRSNDQQLKMRCHFSLMLLAPRGHSVPIQFEEQARSASIRVSISDEPADLGFQPEKPVSLKQLALDPLALQAELTDLKLSLLYGDVDKKYEALQEAQRLEFLALPLLPVIAPLRLVRNDDLSVAANRAYTVISSSSLSEKC